MVVHFRLYLAKLSFGDLRLSQSGKLKVLSILMVVHKSFFQLNVGLCILRLLRINEVKDTFEIKGCTI